MAKEKSKSLPPTTEEKFEILKKKNLALNKRMKRLEAERQVEEDEEEEEEEEEEDSDDEEKEEKGDSFWEG